MKWPEMTPEQRDRLVHEKVMGKTIECCTAPMGGPLNSQHIIVRCDECGYTFPDNDITSHNEYGPDAYPIHIQHDIPVPHYTTDMNAAWQVVDHITDPPTKPLGLKSPNILFTRWWYRSATWACPAQVAAENICLAALRACGAKV